MSDKKDIKADAAPVEGAAKAVKKAAKENPTVLAQKAAKALKLKNKAKYEKDAKAAEDRNDANAKATAADSKKEAKDTRPVFTDERGLKFKFKRSAPKKLNIDGKSRLVAELIKEPEVMLELVNGNSNFIENIQ